MDLGFSYPISVLKTLGCDTITHAVWKSTREYKTVYVHNHPVFAHK